MTSPRSGHVVFALPNGQVAIAGGTDGLGNTLASVEIFNPTVPSFTTAATALDTPRSDAAATELGAGRVLISGGWAQGGRLATMTIFTPCVP